MLKIVIVTILIIHGLIHLLGFVKAFKFAEIEELKLPISKQLGLIWFLVFGLFMFAALQFAFDLEYRRGFILLATISSQALILKSWQDAKYGTVINSIIVILLGLSVLL